MRAFGTWGCRTFARHGRSRCPAEAMAVVKIQLDGGQTITSSVTREAVEDLGLAEGSAVTAMVKSTEVSLAVD